MKSINIPEIDQYKDFSAIFFTQNGILLNAEKLPFHPFFGTKEKLNLSWDSIYLDEGMLIVKAVEGWELPKSFLDEFTISPPKSSLGAVPTPVLHIVLRAIHWVTWSEKMSFCSNCGSKLSDNVQSAKKQCMSCKQIFYPNLAPAVMVLIHKGNEVLLVRSPHFKPGVYGAIAGFIDSGETAEVAAGREVKEEVGLEISNLTYFGTQSWAFPNSFMIVYSAEYVSGDISIDFNELEDARWFHINDLPELPPYPSIVHQIVHSFINKILS